MELFENMQQKINFDIETDILEEITYFNQTRNMQHPKNIKKMNKNKTIKGET